MFLRKFLILATACLLICGQAVALQIPDKPRDYVTDNAGLISGQLETRLSAGLRKFELDSGVQIVVATFTSLEGENLEDFSIRLAERWKIGQQDRDNGVIILVFSQEKKIRIEVGYGLEAQLTDAICSQIISQVMVPAFKNGQADAGIFNGVLSVMKVVMGEGGESSGFSRVVSESDSYQRALTPEEIHQMKQQARAMGWVVLFLTLLFFGIDCFRYKSYVRSHRNSLSHYSFWEWWFRFAILLFILNLLFRILFYSMLFSRGGRYGSRSGFGGFSGGGGGSFGGGGASGGW